MRPGHLHGHLHSQDFVTCYRGIAMHLERVPTPLDLQSSINSLTKCLEIGRGHRFGDTGWRPPPTRALLPPFLPTSPSRLIPGPLPHQPPPTHNHPASSTTYLRQRVRCQLRSFSVRILHECFTRGLGFRFLFLPVMFLPLNHRKSTLRAGEGERSSASAGCGVTCICVATPSPPHRAL